MLKVKNDLGLLDKNAPEYRLNLGDNFRINYMNLNYSGNNTINQTLTYQGTTYNASTNVASDLKLTYVRAAWINSITKSDKLETNWILDLKGFKFDSNVSGDSGGSVVTSTKTYQGIVPTIGFGIKSKLDDNCKAEVGAEITGLPLGKYGKFYDAEAGIKYHFSPDISLSTGYRVFDLNVKHNNDNGEFKLAGTYYGVEYKF